MSEGKSIRKLKDVEVKETDGKSYKDGISDFLKYQSQLKEDGKLGGKKTYSQRAKDSLSRAAWDAEVWFTKMFGGKTRLFSDIALSQDNDSTSKDNDSPSERLKQLLKRVTVENCSEDMQSSLDKFNDECLKPLKKLILEEIKPLMRKYKEKNKKLGKELVKAFQKNLAAIQDPILELDGAFKGATVLNEKQINVRIERLKGETKKIREGWEEITRTLKSFSGTDGNAGDNKKGKSVLKDNKSKMPAMDIKTAISTIEMLYTEIEDRSCIVTKIVKERSHIIMSQKESERLNQFDQGFDQTKETVSNLSEHLQNAENAGISLSEIISKVQNFNDQSQEIIIHFNNQDNSQIDAALERFNSTCDGLEEIWEKVKPDNS